MAPGPGDRKIVPEAAPIPDADAVAEASNIAQEKLANRHERSERFQKHLHWAALFIFWCLVISVVGVGILLLFHMATPADWHFLSEPQRSELKTALLSIIGSQVATEIGRRAMDSSRSN